MEENCRWLSPDEDVFFFSLFIFPYGHRRREEGLLGLLSSPYDRARPREGRGGARRSSARSGSVITSFTFFPSSLPPFFFRHRGSSRYGNRREPNLNAASVDLDVLVPCSAVFSSLPSPRVDPGIELANENRNSSCAIKTAAQRIFSLLSSSTEFQSTNRNIRLNDRVVVGRV